MLYGVSLQLLDVYNALEMAALVFPTNKNHLLQLMTSDLLILD